MILTRRVTRYVVTGSSPYGPDGTLFHEEHGSRQPQPQVGNLICTPKWRIGMRVASVEHYFERCWFGTLIVTTARVSHR